MGVNRACQCSPETPQLPAPLTPRPSRRVTPVEHLRELLQHQPLPAVEKGGVGAATLRACSPATPAQVPARLACHLARPRVPPGSVELEAGDESAPLQARPWLPRCQPSGRRGREASGERA